jgi:hypothetical protein
MTLTISFNLIIDENIVFTRRTSRSRKPQEQFNTPNKNARIGTEARKSQVSKA